MRWAVPILCTMIYRWWSHHSTSSWLSLKGLTLEWDGEGKRKHGWEEAATFSGLCGVYCICQRIY